MQIQKVREVIKPWLRGRDVFRWHAKYTDLYVIFMKHGVDIARYPAIETHLRQYKEQLEKRATSHTHPWYEMQQPQMGYYQQFEKTKIVYQVFQVKPTFAYDSTGSYVNNAIWVIPDPPLFLLALLNSNLGWFLIKNYCTDIQNGYQLIASYFGQIPIANPDKAQQTTIETLVNQLLQHPPPPRRPTRS